MQESLTLSLEGFLFFCLFGIALLTFCRTVGLIMSPIIETLSDIIILVLSLPVLLIVWIFNKVKEALSVK